MKKLGRRKKWDCQLLRAMNSVEKVAIRAVSLAGLAWVIVEILKHHFQM
jgi:hypothetical protein